MSMERLTLRLPEPQIEALEELVEKGHYPNRCEAIRQGVRDLLEEHDERPDARRAPVEVADD